MILEQVSMLKILNQTKRRKADLPSCLRGLKPRVSLTRRTIQQGAQAGAIGGPRGRRITVSS